MTEVIVLYFLVDDETFCASIAINLFHNYIRFQILAYKSTLNSVIKFVLEIKMPSKNCCS